MDCHGCLTAIPVWIGLGGNLDHPAERLPLARIMIAHLEKVREVAFSSLYRSVPMGSPDQPDYVNAVMAIETYLDPFSLLDRLLEIECIFGRIRTGAVWGPRTLDLDILLYGQETVCSDRLTIPHPGLRDREFVLYPLREIASGDLSIPGMGYLEHLVEHCPRRGLTVIEYV